MTKVTLARNAMATRFEFVLRGGNSIALRAAGEEALDEIERLDGQLSLYKPGSEIAQVNLRAASEWVTVSPVVFDVLTRARDLSMRTGGLFDVTVAPLVRAWGFMRSTGSRPTDAEIATAKELAGSTRIELDSARNRVRLQPGMMIDLGSIGKGYALDVAAELIREAGIEHALLHGGTSTVIAFGRDEHEPWKIAIEGPPAEGPSEPLSIVRLDNKSLSVSAVWGKSFVMDGVRYGHVINPRTGYPAEHGLLAAVVRDSATETDALSTAVLLGEKEDLDRLCAMFRNLSYLKVTPAGVQRSGMD